LFLSIHHDSVPDRMLQKWEYEGTARRYNDQYPGHSIFVSIDNPDYQSSLLFATIVGKELKARGLKYTPHYTDAIMGSRRRLLVDTDAGVYRYDQLIVLRQTHMPAVLLEAGSIVNRSEELELRNPSGASSSPPPWAKRWIAIVNCGRQRSRPRKSRPRRRTHIRLPAAH
jgi:N-acetylmuramoyl-L-alanine amidase